MPQANKRASGHRISKSIFLRLSLGLTAKGESLGQVLGYNGCYDSGTCPRDYIKKASFVGKPFCEGERKSD